MSARRNQRQRGAAAADSIINSNSKIGIILMLIQISACKLPGLRINADSVCLF